MENSLLQVGTFSANRGFGGERAFLELQPGRDQQDETGPGLHKEDEINKMKQFAHLDLFSE